MKSIPSAEIQGSPASGRRILVLSGSPSATSKTAKIADWIIGVLKERDQSLSIVHVKARDLDPVALLTADMSNDSLRNLANQFSNAHGVIIATPTFKASYSGLLKASLDVLPQFGLAGKVVLPIATGGSLAHVLAIDYGLRPVLQSMGARHIVQGQFVCEADLSERDGQLIVADTTTAPLNAAINNFLHSLTDNTAVAQLGHPRPE